LRQVIERGAASNAAADYHDASLGFHVIRSCCLPQNEVQSGKTSSIKVWAVQEMRSVQ
jgi:hypothetical protein